MTDWHTILSEIQALQEHARTNGYPLWYRGQSCLDWKLQTSLHRRLEFSFRQIPHAIPEDEKIEILRGIYKSLYQKYKARASHSLSIKEMTDWGTIFSMQHHGVPTRL